MSVFPRLLPGEPHWTASEQAALRDFLSTVIGQLFLQTMIWRRPLVNERHDRDVRIMQSDTLAGYDEAFSTILNLAESQQLTSADRSAQTQS